MKAEIKEILDKFDKVLENYELDKKFGQMSVDSICHLFPSEMVAIKDYITNLQEENDRLKEENKRIFSKVNDDELLISNAMNYAEAQDYKSRCEKLREYINTHQLFKYIYDEEELFEIITDKEAKKDLENILNGGDKDE